MPFRLASTLRLLAATLLLGAGAVVGACGDAVGPAARTGRLEMAASVAGTSAALLAVEVTAADLPGRLVFNLPVEGGVAAGSLEVPAGAARTVTVRAFDALGAETHRGARTLDVHAGANPAVAITLLPTGGEPPITATVGSVTLTLSPADTTLRLGDTLRLRATVRDSAGAAVGAAVQWGTLDARRATVDRHGVVTARDTGVAEIVAVHAGAGARARLRITAP